jgi:gamma-glutamyl hydrolase
MDSYVKYLESSGARTVPLVYQGDMNKILEKIDHLNGIFYPGGGSGQEDFIEMGRAIFMKVKAKNDAGEYYPIWGTCQGF